MTGKKIANELKPYEGWWSDAGKVVARAADDMLAAGMPADAVQNTLADVIAAIRDEYGD